MVNLTIDALNVSVPEGTTVMKAAMELGIEIPHLCFLEGINEISACKVCVVEIQGKEKLITACNSPVEEGMAVYTNSPKVRRVRRSNVELLLSQHDCHCATCVRSGNCNLQKISNDLGILEIPFKEEVPEVPWDSSFPLIRDARKCIKCMRCVQICDKVQDMHVWDVQNTGSRTTVDVARNKTIDASDCTLCGQCITHCPTGALRERNDIPKVFDMLADPEKITVVQVAPAVRTAWGEELGLAPGESTEGRMVAALKRIGFDYVFDTNFAADLTIMEEGSELLERLQKPGKYAWPMFTSCCPGWVKFVEKKYPEMIPHLSTCKSPQQMFGALLKSYWCEKNGINPEDLYVVSVIPCTAKKNECKREEMEKDVDAAITTRELARMIKTAGIKFTELPDEEFDNPFAIATGGGAIFGATGGVMEAALRTAAHMMDGSFEVLDFFAVRGATPIKEATYLVAGNTVRVAVASGLANAETIIKQIQSGEKQYDFIEIMACPGGCVNGGGQPTLSDSVRNSVELKEARAQALYAADVNNSLRRSADSPVMDVIYDDYLQFPNSSKAHKILHTSYKADKKI